MPEADAAPRRPRRAAPIPVYYLAHTDAGSLAMRDAFVASVKDAPGDLELREVLAGDLQCGNQPLVQGVLSKLQTSLSRSNRSRFG
jgi:hypothetical protein